MSAMPVTDPVLSVPPTHVRAVPVPVRDADLTPGQRRSRHLERLSVSATETEDRFDRITTLASTLFGVPMSTVTLVDDDTAHFPGNTGFEGIRLMPRNSVFCDQTVKSGTPLVIEDATADDRFAGLPVVTGPPYLRFYAGVPLDDEDGVTIGTFCLFDTVPRRLDRTQQAMLMQLAAWARRELVDSTEMARARTVQRSLLPARTVAPAGYELAGICTPTKGVGGDFFDHAMIDGRLMLTLMDVMGKGMGAALVAASVRAFVRASVSHQAHLSHLKQGSGPYLGRILTAVDQLLSEDMVQTDSLVTGFAASIEPATGDFAWVDAGHGLAMIVRADGSTERLYGDGLPIGLDLGARWNEYTNRLEVGDTLLVVSDGLFDLLGGTAEKFDEGIRYLVLADPDPQALMERIGELTSLGVALDDVTALALQRTAVAR